MIDTSIVRVHQHGACITRNERQSMGRSRGGLTSKIHAVVDSNGLPVRLALSPERHTTFDSPESCCLVYPAWAKHANRPATIARVISAWLCNLAARVETILIPLSCTRAATSHYCNIGCKFDHPSCCNCQRKLGASIDRSFCSPARMRFRKRRVRPERQRGLQFAA